MKPEHLLEEAGKALKEGLFEKAYESLKEANISLKQLTSVHVGDLRPDRRDINLTGRSRFPGH